MCLLVQSCNVSRSSTVSTSPVFHFGESPCLGEASDLEASTSYKVGRAVVKRSFPKEIPSGNWSISMHIALNRNGKVVYAEYLPDLSSIKDQKVIKSCIEAMSKTTFEEDPNGPEYECGRWTINFSSID